MNPNQALEMNIIDKRSFFETKIYCVSCCLLLRLIFMTKQTNAIE